MKREITHLIRLTTLILAASIFQSCISSDNADDQVTVTIEPLRYFVDRLTSESIDVNVMVSEGANPATYSPTTRQLTRLSSSILYLKVGHLGFEESWMTRLEELNPDMKVLDLSGNVSLIRSDDFVHGDHVHEGGVDPHTWMSPKVVKSFLPRIKETLVKYYPKHKHIIEENFITLMAEIQTIDKEYERITTDLKHRKFMIFHPALTYLARDYDLEQVSIEYEGKEPSPQKLRELIDVANNQNIPVIFIQAEFDKRGAKMVVDATGAELVVINPLAYEWKKSVTEILRFFEEYLK